MIQILFDQSTPLNIKQTKPSRAHDRPVTFSLSHAQNAADLALLSL